MPRDAGAGWDFDDVRDHYLELAVRGRSRRLRRIDHERYLELSRAVTGEVMAEVFGEWRRSRLAVRRRDWCSGCATSWPAPAGGCSTIAAGRRPPSIICAAILAPMAVWLVDEGIGGVDRARRERRLRRRSRLGCGWRCTETRGARRRRASKGSVLAPTASHERNIEAIIGRFVDISWAYRFGPPAQNLVVASLEREIGDGVELLSQSFRFPAGRPRIEESTAELGLRAECREQPDGSLRLSVSSRRLAYGVRLQVTGFVATDDAFSVEPGGTRSLVLWPEVAASPPAEGTMRALNLDGCLRFAISEIAS